MLNTPLCLSGKTIARSSYDVMVNTKILGCRDEKVVAEWTGRGDTARSASLECRWAQRNDDKSIG